MITKAAEELAVRPGFLEGQEGLNKALWEEEGQMGKVYKGMASGAGNGLGIGGVAGALLALASKKDPRKGGLAGAALCTWG